MLEKLGWKAEQSEGGGGAKAPVISRVLLRPQSAEQLMAANDDRIEDKELVADTSGNKRILKVLAAL